MRRGILIGLGAVAAVALSAGAVWRLVLREQVEPASVDEAVARFREAALRGDTPIPAGVYLYATTGTESISALGGRRHRYPARSTLTVTSGGCGMQLRWDVLRTRRTTWEVCPEGGGQRLAAWVEAHNFVGRDDVTTWRCDGTAWLPPDPTAGSATPRFLNSMPNTSVAAACRKNSTPPVTSSWLIGSAPSTGRITNWCSSTPSSATMPMAQSIAGTSGQWYCTCR